MAGDKIKLKGAIHFKIRFNTTHGETDLFWRVIIASEEYLVNAIDCKVPTYSDKSFDEKASAIKFHIAGECCSFVINEENKAIIN